MNKIKFKIKIPNKFIKLNNYFIDQFNKFKKIKFKIKIPNKFIKLNITLLINLTNLKNLKNLNLKTLVILVYL